MTSQHTQPDNQEQYTVHNQKLIVQILTDLAVQKTMITVSVNHGNDSCSTTVIAVDTENHAAYFDIGLDEAFNSRLLASHHVVFSKDDGLRTEWITTHLSAVRIKGGKALKIDLPRSLIHVQRREFIRLATPISHPVYCRIPFHDPANADENSELELTLVDISLGGIGVVVPDPFPPGMVEGSHLEGCKIGFPGIGEANLTLCINRVMPITTKDGSIKHRMGLEYIEPSRGNQGLIERYIAKLEREIVAAAKITR